MKKVISIILAVVMLFSMSVTAFAAEPTIEDDSVISLPSAVTESAGLAFGPLTIGNITFRVTNAHSHNIPGYGVVEHINFHIDNADTGKEIKNYHIFTQMNANGKECLVVYESKSATEVFRNCNDTLGSQVSAFFSIVSEIVRGLLSEANFITATAIIAIIVVLVVDLVLPLDPLPFLPASIDPVESIA